MTNPNNPYPYGPGYRQAPIGNVGQVAPGLPGAPMINQNVIQQTQPQQQQMQMPQTSGYEALVQALAAKQAMGQSDRFRDSASGIFAQKGKVKSALLGGLASYLADRKEGEAYDAMKESARLEDEEKQKPVKAIASLAKAMIPGLDDQTAMEIAVAVKAGAITLKDLQGPEPSADVVNRTERAQFLKENPEIVQRIGQDAADKFYLTGNWSDKKGATLTVADGVVTYSENGQAVVQSPTKAVETQLQTEALSADEAMEGLNYIKETAKEGYLTNFGRVKSWLGGKLDRAGLSGNDLSQFAAERGAWSRRVMERVFQYRKMITGVAGGEKEMQKIEQMVANPDLGPAEFAAVVEQEVKAAQRDANLIRQAQGKEPMDFPEFKFSFGGDKEDKTTVINYDAQGNRID